MTTLNCSATTCMFNKDELCCRGSIEVNGPSARSSGETCCQSFHERHSDRMTNSTSEGKGCEKIQIACAAQNCTYNDSCKCTASAIDISGSGASSVQETECSTFHCGCRC